MPDPADTVVAPVQPAAPSLAMPTVIATALPPAPSPDANGFDPDAYDWVPVPRERRADGWTPEKQRAFIGYLADTGSVRTAAQESGMSASSAYRLRRAPEGQGFAAAWEAAIQQAAHALVDAAFERAVHGSEEPVFDRDGRVIGRRFRQSDGMMMFLLRKHFPDRYGDLHRDRAPSSNTATPAVPPTPPVADTIARLGPVRPADPAATLDPDRLDLYVARADNGRHPERPGGEDALARGGLGPDFEAALAQAKRAASGHFRDDDDDGDDEYCDIDEDDGDLFASPDTA